MNIYIWLAFNAGILFATLAGFIRWLWVGRKRELKAIERKHKLSSAELEIYLLKSDMSFAAENLSGVKNPELRVVIALLTLNKRVK